ncbi:MAG TPA: hypothetical protein VHZ81_03430 [Galbitalea sp.]|jgi:hypothetical protein|nr:hypothetical protein [Galbitalea sp.]
MSFERSSFGGVPASITQDAPLFTVVISPDGIGTADLRVTMSVGTPTITATTPPATTGAVDFVVTGPGGTSTVASFTFTVAPMLGETGVDVGTGLALGLVLLVSGAAVVLYRRLRARLA